MVFEPTAGCELEAWLVQAKPSEWTCRTEAAYRYDGLPADADAAERGSIWGPAGLRLAEACVFMAGELGGATRATVVQTLAAGLVLVAVVMYSSLHATRRDFGRRRALGATRSQLVTIVLLHVTYASVAGAVAGAVAGSFVTYFLTGEWPGWAYPVAVSALAVLTNLVAAAIPAVIAARRDPVLALRVP